MKMTEFNKIFGAATAALLVFLLANFASESLYEVHEAREPAYPIGIPEEGETETADASEAEAEPEMSLAQLLQNASIDDGEKQFKKCAACHKIAEGQNAVGPSLWNVVGRDVGSVEGFRYSGALSEQADVWTWDNLFHFIENPKAWAPGTAMSFAGLSDPQDRANVLAYINQAGDDPQPLPELEAAPEPAAEAPAAEDSAGDAAAADEAAGDAAEAAPEADGMREVETTEDAPAPTPAEGEASSEQVAALSDETSETGGGEDAQAATEASRAAVEESMPKEVEPAEGDPAQMAFVNALKTVNAEQGEKVFQQCAACHRIAKGEHGIAPSLYGVIGREAASVKYFPYSDALRKLEGPWTPQKLNVYLQDPAAYAPGNHMAFHGLDSQQDRAAVITYLNEADGTPEDLVAMVEQGDGPVTDAVVEAADSAGEAIAAVEETVADAAGAVEEAVTGDDSTEEAPAAAETPAEPETAATDAEEAPAAEAETETAESPAPAAAETEAAATETADASAPAEAEETEVAALAESEAPAAAEAEEAAPAAASSPVLEGVSAEFAAALQSASADDGKKVFRKCQACHRVEEGKNMVGPSLWGVVGRDIGSIENFKYSDAIASLEGIWTYEKMNQYLTDPRAYAPGNKMAFAGLKDMADRAAVVKYLNEADGDPAPLPQP